MPLDKHKGKAALSRNIAELVRSGRPKAQAAAIAYDLQRRLGKKRKKKN